MSKYKIIALVGESGSGKDSILKKVLNKYPLAFNQIINTTTRPIREGEVDGVNYFYISPEEFAEKVLDCEMLEATSFNDWFYGTSYDTLRRDIPNIGVFNPDGLRAIQGRIDIDLSIFRVTCSNKTRLLRQLNREENPDVDEIVRRYKADQNDFYGLEEEFLCFEIPNETVADLEESAEKILSCVQGEML